MIMYIPGRCEGLTISWNELMISKFKEVKIRKAQNSKDGFSSLASFHLQAKLHVHLFLTI
jgi:hypothetical protein